MSESGGTRTATNGIKSNLPDFSKDNLDFYPFVNQIEAELEKSQKGCLTVKFNILMCGFGYLEYDDSVKIEIQKYLNFNNLFVQIPLDRDLNREDTVSIVRINKGKQTRSSLQSEKKVSSSKISPIQEAINSTVQIITPSGSVGTGFIIDNRGIIVTARHVVDENGYSFRKVLVRQYIQKPEERELEAIVFRSHRKLDYALLWILDDGYYPELKLGEPKKLDYSQTVYAIGCPGGLPITVTRGIIGNPNINYNQLDCIQCDAAIDHGNSGGPLINEEGEVLGITLWGLGDFAGAKLSLPIDYVLEDLEIARRYGKNASLQSIYCPACGYTDYSKNLWYCSNCGFQYESEDE